MRGRLPFLPLLTGLLTGILLARFGAGWCTLSAALLLAVWMYAAQKIRSRKSLAQAYLTETRTDLIPAIFCVAAGITTAMYHAPSAPESLKQDFPDYAEARVKEVAHATNGGERIIADIIAFRDENDSLRNTQTRNLRALLHSKDYGHQPGDIILFRHNLQKPHDSENTFFPYFTKWAERKGITHTQSLGKGGITRLSHRHSLTTISKAERDRISTAIDRSSLNPNTSSLLKAITLGDTDATLKSLRDDFSDAGLAHILSLSGLHVGIVGSLIFIFLMPLNLTRAWRWRYPTAILSIWIYVWLTGLHIPAIRAAIMLTFYLAGKFMERPTMSLNTLAGAAFIILLFSPGALFEAGFQLSCVCVLSLVGFSSVIQPNFLRRQRILSFIYGTMASSFLATSGSAALIAYHFGKLPLYFLPSNLIAAPVLPLFMLSGSLHTLLETYGITPHWLTMSVDFLSDILCGTATFFSKAPYSSVPVNASLTATLLWTLALPLGIVAAESAMRKITRRITASTAGIMLITAAVITFCFPANAETPEHGFIIQNVRSDVRITVLEKGEESVITIPERRDTTHTVCGKSIACVGTNRYSSKSRKPHPLPYSPQTCDILLIERSYNSNLSDLLRYFKPARIVTHAGVSSDIRISLKAECRKMSIPYYSIREEGPYRLEW